MKVIIVGGVAAGASAAARLRRLDEFAEIIMLEKGQHISYANCGLPYHLGGVIPQRDSLLVMEQEELAAWFNIDIRTNNEVVAIQRKEKKVRVRTSSGDEYEETYDKLLIATGARPIEVDIPGMDDPRVHRLWTIYDMDALSEQIARGAKRAIVVGAGFVGLEAAENLSERGLDVTVVQRSNHVLPTVDPDMSVFLVQELANNGISVCMQRQIVRLDKTDSGLVAMLDDGDRLETDLVIICTGVKPNSELAQAAGLEMAASGHIVVDEQLLTSDPDIYAAGDVIEVKCPITGGKTAILLAGPANKQGRIAADNIAGRKNSYPGTFGNNIVKVGRLTAGGVGFTEARAKQAGLKYQKVYLHPFSSAGYYPGKSLMHIKLLFADDGQIIGVQIVGGKGVDKRIDTIAVAMRGGLKAQELATLELAYAPPFNSAKDPVNFAGFLAENVLSGVSKIVHADALPAGAQVVDTREAEEFDLDAIPGAINIPLGELRQRLGELDRQRQLVVYCQVGMRGYLAECLLRQRGFKVCNLSGGLLTWKAFHPEPVVVRQKKAAVEKAVPQAAPAPSASDSGREVTLDARGMACPGPVIALKKQFDLLAAGDRVRLLAPPSFAPDLHQWIASTGNQLLDLQETADELQAVLAKAGAPMTAPAGTAPTAGHSAALVLFSNDLDKALAALIIACGMAAAGAKVGIFFTFWGLSVLRRNPAPPVKKSWLGKMFGMMLPKGANKLTLSKMNMAGMGTTMMKQVMAQQNVTSLPDLLRQAKELGVKFIACEMAMDVMGVKREELLEVDEVAGVASFVALARESNNTLFI